MREYLTGTAAKPSNIQALYTISWVGLVGELPKGQHSDGV